MLCVSTSAHTEKSLFGMRELVTLGHIIGSGGVKIDPEKTKSVREWPTPK
jgi:hypothetical protein